jgi:hypothetical protein
MRSRTSVTLLALAFSIALSANSAVSAIVHCVGHATAKSGTVFGGGEIEKYFKVGNNYFAMFKNGVWTDNWCVLEPGACQTTKDEYAVTINTDHAASNLTDVISINRKTGDVNEVVQFVNGDMITFSGNCRISVDPAPATPNKF